MEWFKTHNLDPLTGAAVSSKVLVPNTVLRSLIGAYKDNRLTFQDPRLR